MYFGWWVGGGLVCDMWMIMFFVVEGIVWIGGFWGGGFGGMGSGLECVVCWGCWRVCWWWAAGGREAGVGSQDWYSWWKFVWGMGKTREGIWE